MKLKILLALLTLGVSTMYGCSGLSEEAKNVANETAEKIYTESAEKLREEFKTSLQDLGVEFNEITDDVIEEILKENEQKISSSSKTISLAEGIPQHQGESFTILNNNIPQFTEEEKLKTETFEEYTELDSLGRAVQAYALVGKETMPTEERQSIGHVKPSGWHTVKYPEVIEDNYLYNRCHLIAFSLSGENANEMNLITGTRYMNVSGMLPYEIQVADYIDKTSNHVLYRVTPIYDGENLVAAGVQMEAYSIEDQGEGICFNVFVHNVQPGIEIDYKTGESKLVQE